MRRFAFTLAVVTLVTAASYCAADDTSPADEKIAQAIVETLREHQEAGRLKGFDIDLNVENGRVALTGNVADESQHKIAIDAARFAPGVKIVVNDLRIRGATHEHPEQQKKLGANLAAMLQNDSMAQGSSNSGLLTGLRKAWAQPNAEQTAQQQQQAVQPVADALPPAGTNAQQAAPALPEQATGKQIDELANPNPLTHDDRHIAGGYSAFTRRNAQTPVATIGQVTGAPAIETAQPIATQPAESIVAAPATAQAQSQLSRWQPREVNQTPDAQPQVAQAIAGGNQQPAQPASAAVARTQPQQPQMQAIQFIPVPVAAYPQAQQMQRMQRMPVAYAASRLPGGQVRMAQAMSPQQVQPVPQFIQGTGGGGAPARYDHPQMPGYAWPSYASYPNYAALQYPKQYSAHAWPYIGPFYPYPQVPLGWRKVTLSWDDGWWHLDFKDRGYGPYVTR